MAKDQDNFQRQLSPQQVAQEFELINQAFLKASRHTMNIVFHAPGPAAILALRDYGTVAYTSLRRLRLSMTILESQGVNASDFLELDESFEGILPTFYELWKELDKDAVDCVEHQANPDAGEMFTLWTTISASYQNALELCTGAYAIAVKLEAVGAPGMSTPLFPGEDSSPN